MSKILDYHHYLLIDPLLYMYFQNCMSLKYDQVIFISAEYFAIGVLTVDANQLERLNKC